MKFIWSLFARAGSLRAIWVHSNSLKNKCFEFHPQKFSEPTKQDWFGGIGRGRQASLDSIQIQSLHLCKTLESHQKQKPISELVESGLVSQPYPQHAFIGWLVIDQQQRIDCYNGGSILIHNVLYVGTKQRTKIT